MSGTSTKTVVVGIRLPVEAAKKAKVRAAANDLTVSQYLAKILMLQLSRKR